LQRVHKVKTIGNPAIIGEGEIKYYASIDRDTRVDTRTILDEISELNVAHSGAILAVLETFLSRIHYHLVNGRGVELGQMGTFYPSISSGSASKAEDITRESIKRLKVLFRPSKLLKDRLSTVKFEKVVDDKPEAPQT
jgi:predicted histone-like DNA-binding protein